MHTELYDKETFKMTYNIEEDSWITQNHFFFSFLGQKCFYLNRRIMHFGFFASWLYLADSGLSWK